ncbi:hypothetical protein TSTA_001100 [Talaromyces stipitatus ATCC 10500]|uniref:Reverse transcriptase Ty1/copia-type domain-containing protein n=1 Tax=Talaromyces stipitatus (strain ATCC 10500 / CBS 375.48 / QM 6759 / NRRL 1006) TaxID=441959 RepID=B8MT14_TALSN|nr:uncharacterized protein TSTA_001100 [Talaromyces stipitatus ATCC 10500]EED12038.1 hypothetical protein TSTA_001100 [Talaromyces stipitatus ATCC 10500]
MFMRMPPGYRTLINLEFKAIPQEPCCMLKSGIILFFYVDDIVVAYKKDREAEAKSVMKELCAKYHITSGEDLEWFLGM